MASINKILYPIFILRLSFLLLSFLLKVFFNLYPKIILVVLSLLIALINSAIFIKNKTTKSSATNPETNIGLEKNSLENIKIQLEEALNKQDSHQGILLNLSRVEKELNQNDLAEEFLKRAKKQSPNSDYFQN